MVILVFNFINKLIALNLKNRVLLFFLTRHFTTSQERQKRISNKQEPFGTNMVVIGVISRKPLNPYLLQTIPYKQKLKLSNWDHYPLDNVFN